MAKSLFLAHTWLLLALATTCCPPRTFFVQAQQEGEVPRNYTFADLAPCALTSLELSKLGADDYVEPCILAHVQPTVPPKTSRSALVTSVQVTPVHCSSHRDGAVTAARILNADNDNQGVAIGFQQDYFVQFQHVSIIAGNPATMATDEYQRLHAQLLETLVVELEVQYIAGSCSFASAIEKEPARRLQKMVLAMVGPPGFYKDGPDGTEVNPYVFGIHINSDTYGKPAIQQLAFLPEGPETIPVRILYRQKSEFFYSTCRAVLEAAQEFGFKDVETVLYEHDRDHDGDGTINQFDEDFLTLLADQICPPTQEGATESFHPAIFACTLTEQDILLERWRENGCQPYSMWMTPSTWTWATNNKDLVPYFQGGGQWHPALKYGDKYFETGADLIDYNEPIFGYRGNYDMVVSYAMVVLFAQHLQAAYRILDEPNPAADFRTPEGYERLRRDMIILNVETIFGTVSFNEFQRNEGRGAAGTQWLPVEADSNKTDTTEFENFLVSPFLQAERAVLAPSPVSVPCDAGYFNNGTRTELEESLMLEKCSTCPVDTFTDLPNLHLHCQACPSGSNTEFQDGQTFCTTVDDNLVGAGLHVLGNFGVLCTWILAIYFGSWTIRHRNDSVVKIGQAEFLLTICVAAMVSSSSVVFLGFEAGSYEDETLADLGCQIAPFLYAAGWVTEYSSLSVKTYRLFRVTSNQNNFRRVQIHSYHMFGFVLLLLVIEMGLVTCMTIFTPLEYMREITNRDVTDSIVTIKTSGSCSSDDDAWVFLGPLVAIHASLQLGTNWLLFTVRGVNERYQEQKYVALASLFVLEVLVIGVPVLVAVQDSPAARYIVMSAIVVLNDIGILCFVFLPKMRFQKVGLPEGVGVGESINRESMHRAMSRRSQTFAMNSQFPASQFPTGSGHGSVDFNGSDEGTDEEDDMPGGNHSGKSLPGTNKPSGTRNWGLGFMSTKSAGGPDELPRDSWGGTGFKSTVDDNNLESIMEAVGECSDSEDKSLSDPLPIKAATGAVASTRSNSNHDSSGRKERPATNELIGDVKARVREKLAKRLASSQTKVPETTPEAAPPTRNATNSAVSTSANEASLYDDANDGDSSEFEERLMNRLGKDSNQAKPTSN